MKKLTLDLDRLAVETFAADAVPAEDGTVNGQELAPTNAHSCQRTPCCPDTFQVTCAATCTC